MNKVCVVILVCLGLLACQKSEPVIIEGDLYFQVLDFERLFDAPDSVLSHIETTVRAVNLDTIPEHEQAMYNLLKYMVDNQLLRKPFIRLNLNNGERTVLFLDSASYQAFADLKALELRRENKKIKVKAQVRPLEHGERTAYQALQVLAVKKVEGQTVMIK